MSFLKKDKTDWNFILVIVILAAIVGGWIFYLSSEKGGFVAGPLEINKIEEFKEDLSKTDVSKIDNNEDGIDVNKYDVDATRFRNLVIKFVREIAENYLDDGVSEVPEELKIEGNWEPHVIMYCKGEIKGEGSGEDKILSLALEKAVKNVLESEKCKSLTEENLKAAVFLVKFFYPPEQFSFVEHNAQVKEVIGDLVVIRNLDKELILQKIKQGKEFLYRMENEAEHGFYKKYDTLNDSFENRLHTVYSASIIYTFLYIYDLEKDEKILDEASDWADFLLSMQNKDKKDRNYGAFHYSYFLSDSGEKEKKFVVGTAALSIFTLLRLYDLSGELKYLESAKLAGDWLVTMQKPDGSMKPYTRYSGGKWVYGTKLSLLYNGQVLSSLSKLYKVTGDKKYYEAAKGIADLFAEKYEKEQGYIEGEYRTKNPISNSWVVMSLMDFYKVNQNDYYKNIIFELSEEILKNQKNDSDDLLYYGGWGGAYSTSGIGWIDEVMVEMYIFCKAQNVDDSVNGCEKYKDAVVKAIRWLVQNTYSEENTFFLKKPEKAIGGVFWNKLNKYVRTDSVCHALNGYIRIIDDLGDELLLSIPERPFEEILDELKK